MSPKKVLPKLNSLLIDEQTEFYSSLLLNDLAPSVTFHNQVDTAQSPTLKSKEDTFDKEIITKSMI